ncbi:sulfotransferase domain-containing protein [Cyanobium sp. FGCU-6]|nr:sulfotransferase domain-containing protein [Cyanobium sp. FGCU6]
MSDTVNLEAIAHQLPERPAEALAALRRLPWPQPDPLTSVLMGDALRRLGDPEQALPWLEAGCGALPRGGAAPASGHWSRGLALRGLGRFQEAAEAFLDAIEAQPDFLPATHALQFTRLEGEEVKSLLSRLGALAERSQTPPLTAMVLAEWERRCGLVEPALIRSQRAARGATRSSLRHLLDPGSLPTPPEALIVGTPKSGTTSLLAWLNGQGGIWAHPRKELHFFDNGWPWGRSWYVCQFPVFRPGSGIVRLEATPNYFQLAECPERVRTIAPEARLVVVLREPVQRALSWFHHLQRQEGLAGEPVRTLEAEEAHLLALSNEEREAMGYRAPNCLAGSLYDLHLKRWQAVFPSEQLLLLCLEDLLEDPEAGLARVRSFLGLPAAPAIRAGPLPRANAAPTPYGELPAGVGRRLREGILSGAHDLWRSTLRHAPHNRPGVG